MDLAEIRDRIQKKEWRDEHLQLMDSHLSKFYTNSEISVMHEIFSLDTLRIHVYMINSDKHPFNILLTSGMSSIEMNLDEDDQDRDKLKFAELMVLVPKEMEFGSNLPSDSPDSWVMDMLKDTARFPHHYDTWLQTGHTVQAQYDLSPYSGQTEFAGVVVLPSFLFNSDFTKIKTSDSVINIYTLFPLYNNELEFKIANGYNALAKILEESDIDFTINNKRANLLVAKK